MKGKVNILFLIFCVLTTMASCSRVGTHIKTYQLKVGDSVTFDSWTETDYRGEKESKYLKGTINTGSVFYCSNLEIAEAGPVKSIKEIVYPATQFSKSVNIKNGYGYFLKSTVASEPRLKDYTYRMWVGYDGKGNYTLQCQRVTPDEWDSFD